MCFPVYEIISLVSAIFCKLFTRHVLIDSKGLGCPGQEAVPPQESDSKSAPSLEPLEVSGDQELRSLHGCDVLSRGRGAIKSPGPGVCSIDNLMLYASLNLGAKISLL